MKVSDLVGKYIELRDKKAQLKAEYDEKVSKIDAGLDKIEAKFLEVFDQTGMESIRTEFGTASASIRASATIADREALMEFVKKTNEWPLLQISVNKPAVSQYISAMDEVPPGVNWRTERVLSIRRS